MSANEDNKPTKEVLSKAQQKWSECYYDVAEVCGGEKGVDETIFKDFMGDWLHDMGVPMELLTSDYIQEVTNAVYYGGRR